MLAQRELAKKMMQGEIKGNMAPEEFGAMYMQDEWDKRPRRPTYRFEMSVPEIHSLIQRGMKTNIHQKREKAKERAHRFDEP